MVAGRVTVLVLRFSVAASFKSVTPASAIFAVVTSPSTSVAVAVGLAVEVSLSAVATSPLVH
jgi:hypothetical protein